MSKISVIPNPVRINKDGSRTLVIRLSIIGKSKYYATVIKVRPDQWNNRLQQYKTKYANLNEGLFTIQAKAQAILINLENSNMLSFARFELELNRKAKHIDVLTFLDRHIESLKGIDKIRNAMTYQELQNLLVKFGTSKKLMAAEISRQINRLKLHARKDKIPVPSSQISARARRYPDLFSRDGSKICLKSRVSSTVGKEKQQPDSREKTSNRSNVSISNELIFSDIGFIGDLIYHGLPTDRWLDKCGIYKIVIPSDYEPEFISPEETQSEGNVISAWPVSRLEDKWVSNTSIVYIGLAGRNTPRSLRKRLYDLLKHGSGRTSDRGPHKGGEILWQLRGYLGFKISAAPTANPPIPRKMEEMLLEQFISQYGKLPFANRQM